MKAQHLHVADDFVEVDTRTLDDRHRLCVGDCLEGFQRVRVFQNKNGELFLRPVVEIPASEAWLFKKKSVLRSVQKGLEDASQGKISKLDLRTL